MTGTTGSGGGARRRSPAENGFEAVMAIGAGAAVLAFALASFLLRHRPTAPAPASEPAEPSAEPVG